MNRYLLHSSRILLHFKTLLLHWTTVLLHSGIWSSKCHIHTKIQVSLRFHCIRINQTSTFFETFLRTHQRHNSKQPSLTLDCFPLLLCLFMLESQLKPHRYSKQIGSFTFGKRFASINISSANHRSHFDLNRFEMSSIVEEEVVESSISAEKQRLSIDLL